VPGPARREGAHRRLLRPRRQPADRARRPLLRREQDVDLNAVFGTRNKTYKARGLLRIFDSYKFTIEENTPIEEEIALDPELLGKVFENLLAAYNPETGTTARKQTGSFYTPREIVDYMVDESLLAYLETALADRNRIQVLEKSGRRTRPACATCWPTATTPTASTRPRPRSADRGHRPAQMPGPGLRLRRVPHGHAAQAGLRAGPIGPR
jgi:hypothetical protein